MATLNHPTIIGHQIDVPDGQVGEWLAQGWKSNASEPADPTPEHVTTEEN